MIGLPFQAEEVVMEMPWWALLLTGILLGVGGARFNRLFTPFLLASWAAFGGAVYASGVFSGPASWLRTTVSIVVGLIAAVAGGKFWAKVLDRGEPADRDQPMGAELVQSLRDKGAVPVSPFPLCDDTGHLICKNCGVPFSTATLETARAHIKTSITIAAFLAKCASCGKVSVFTRREIEQARAER